MDGWDPGKSTKYRRQKRKWMCVLDQQSEVPQGKPKTNKKEELAVEKKKKKRNCFSPFSNGMDEQGGRGKENDQ